MHHSTGRRRVTRLRLSLVAALAFVASASLARAEGPNFTFLFTADTHYGLDLWRNNEPANKALIDQMNALPGTPLPASLGGVVDTPKGVLIAGDLTDTPEYLNFFGLHLPPYVRDAFNDDYAVDGSGRIHYPVYEGYGNHDIDNFAHSYTLDGIAQRNLVRPGITHLSPNGLNYSWDWEGVHFVNLNIYAGRNDRSAYSLDFLIDDLRQYVGDSGRPVVLMQHFGFDGFSLGWWSEAERTAFADAIDDYNVIGIFHGHLHTTLKYQWQGYDVFDGSAAKDGNYLVVRIANGRLDVASREDGEWGFAFSKAITLGVPEANALLLLSIPAAWLAWASGKKSILNVLS